MTDLEKLIRDRQDAIRGYPLSPPTWRDRLRDRLPDWRYIAGAPLLLGIASVLMFIAAILQFLEIVARYS